MKPTCPYLFVYGTLRKDAQSDMFRVLAKDGRLIGAAKMPGRLYNLGEYPGMIDAREQDDWVRGELYKLNDPDQTLAVLDEYEGCGPKDDPHHEFERRLAEATLENDTRQTAWVYMYRLPVPEQRRILSGDYLVKNRGR